MADKCAYLQINHKSLNMNIFNNSLQGIKTIRWAELQASWSLLRNFRLSHVARLQWERVNYSPLCFPFVFDIRSFCDFWVIAEPVLPNCKQVLWFVCLSDYIKEVWFPTQGLPYCTLSAVSFHHPFTAVLLGVVFVLFCFLNTENILVCLWIQLIFPCTKSDNTHHLSQGMKYQTLLIQTASKGSVPDPGRCQTCVGKEHVLRKSMSRIHFRSKCTWLQDIDQKSPMPLDQIASLQPREIPGFSVIILLRF